MVKRTYQLRKEDAERLVSLACRYRSTRTHIDETNGIMDVDTTFADNDEPTSEAAHFVLETLSNEPPRMPDDEYQKRVMGKFPADAG